VTMRAASCCVGVLLLIPLLSPAWACTLCHTDTAKQVRAGIFNVDFAQNLAVSLLPFVLMLAIAALIHQPSNRP
jgi:hypothetical protein